MATKDSPPSKKIFPFFRLPRELRDNIYDFLPTGRRPIQAASEVYRVWLGDRPMQHQMLVSKVFNIEYSKGAQKKKHVRIQYMRETEILEFPLPTEVIAAPAITFDLACTINNYQDELEDHATVVKDILSQMTAKPLIRFRLYLQVDLPNKAAKLDEDEQSTIQDLKKLPGAASLKIFSYVEREPKPEEVEGHLQESYECSRA